MTTIDIQDLKFNYPDGHPALLGISLRVMPGERVALVGPNGAGKSTLMLHLNGILQGQGRVQVCGWSLDNGHPSSSLSQRPPMGRTNLGQVRAAVGLVFQDPDDQLFSPTVYEDVAFGPLHMGLPAAEVRQRVEAALKAVGMGEFAERVSHHLSVGEKKRIAIATVLSMDAQLLVLDEPTAGLDPRARRGIINLLRELPQTVLASTHDLLFVRELFPRMVIMDKGRIVADGATAALLNDQALLEAHGLELPR